MIAISHLASNGEPIAPAGFVFVCLACGKTSRGQWGTDSMPGWDASCKMNSSLVPEVNLVRSTESGLVIGITE